MHLKVLSIFVFVILTTGIMATELVVHTPYNSYTLNYSENDVSLASTHYSFIIKKNPCNKVPLTAFNKSVNHLIATNALDSNMGAKQISFSLNSKQYYADKKSRLGIGLLSIPRSVRRLAVNDKINCK